MQITQTSSADIFCCQIFSRAKVSIMGRMKDSHRRFLQSFMASYILSGKEVKTLYRKCLEYTNDVDPDCKELADFVNTIILCIKPMHMNITKAIDEQTGLVYYVLVNDADNDITHMQSDFSPVELEFLKKLIEEIVIADGTIPHTKAYNLDVGRKMSLEDVKKFIKFLTNNKWISIFEGKIRLSTRTIAELENYILDQYDGTAVKCYVCKRLCLFGQNCDSCDLKLHLACSNKLLKPSPNDAPPKCPDRNCNGSIQQDDYQNSDSQGNHDTQLARPRRSQVRKGNYASPKRRVRTASKRPRDTDD